MIVLVNMEPLTILMGCYVHFKKKIVNEHYRISVAIVYLPRNQMHKSLTADE